MGDSVDHAIRVLGERNWRNLALNREEWRTLLKKARAHAGLSRQWWWWWWVPWKLRDAYYHHQGALVTVVSTSGTSVNLYRTALRNVPERCRLEEIPRLYATRRLMALFPGARQSSQSWSRSIHSTPSHPVSLRFVIVLSSHLRLCLANGLFSLDFPTDFRQSFLVFSLHVAYPL
jgi:hypothetical protein